MLQGDECDEHIIYICDITFPELIWKTKGTLPCVSQVVENGL